MLDGMNLMDAIVQSPQRYTFTPPITMADIRAAANGYQEDLQIVAAAASAAMDHPASAKMPAVFANEKNQKFPQGFPPTPMPELAKGTIATLAARGKIIARSDPLLSALYELEPVGLNLLGFEVGLAIDEGGTLQGPGKEKFKNELGVGVSKEAYQRADFTIDRNANSDIATRGSAAVAANPEATAARAKLPMSNQWLGFNIAAGLFGKVTDGALGNTLRVQAPIGSENGLVRPRGLGTTLRWPSTRFREAQWARGKQRVVGRDDLQLMIFGRGSMTPVPIMSCGPSASSSRRAERIPLISGNEQAAG